jgi:hypothetical protein
MPTGHLKSIVDLFHKSKHLLNYDNMDTDLSIGAAVSIIATLACNKYRFGSVWPNVYVFLLGNTYNKVKPYNNPISHTGLAYSLCKKIDGLRVFGEQPPTSVADFLNKFNSCTVRLSFYMGNSGGFLETYNDTPGLSEEVIDCYDLSNTYYFPKYFLQNEYSELISPQANFCNNILIKKTLFQDQPLFKKKVEANLKNRLIVFKTWVDEWAYPEHICSKPVEFIEEEYLAAEDELAFQLSLIGKGIKSPVDIPICPKAQIELERALDHIMRGITCVGVNDSTKGFIHNKDSPRHMASHFLKLSLIHSVSNGAKEITVEDVVWAEETTTESTANLCFVP